MKVLFATTNPAKVKKYRKVLEENGIELLTITDLEKKVEIDEIGKDALENAYIKAKTYYDLTGITTIGMDNTLFIEGISNKKQPGTHVRRVSGKRLSDEEMIEYYTSMAKENGAKLVAKWRYGMVIYNKNEVKRYMWDTEDFYIIDKPSKIRTPGYPLDSISIDPSCNKYFVEMTSEDKKNSKKQKSTDLSIKFLLNNIKDDQGE